MSFQFQMSNREREGTKLHHSSLIFPILGFGTNAKLITPQETSGLKTGVDNGKFWSEIGLGFEEPDSTALRGIPQALGVDEQT